MGMFGKRNPHIEGKHSKENLRQETGDQARQNQSEIGVLHSSPQDSIDRFKRHKVFLMLLLLLLLLDTIYVDTICNFSESGVPTNGCGYNGETVKLHGKTFPACLALSKEAHFCNVARMAPLPRRDRSGMEWSCSKTDEVFQVYIK